MALMFLVRLGYATFSFCGTNVSCHTGLCSQLSIEHGKTIAKINNNEVYRRHRQILSTMIGRTDRTSSDLYTFVTAAHTEKLTCNSNKTFYVGL